MLDRPLVQIVNVSVVGQFENADVALHQSAMSANETLRRGSTAIPFSIFPCVSTRPSRQESPDSCFLCVFKVTTSKCFIQALSEHFHI